MHQNERIRQGQFISAQGAEMRGVRCRAGRGRRGMARGSEAWVRPQSHPLTLPPDPRPVGSPPVRLVRAKGHRVHVSTIDVSQTPVALIDARFLLTVHCPQRALREPAGQGEAQAWAKLARPTEPVSGRSAIRVCGDATTTAAAQADQARRRSQRVSSHHRVPDPARPCRGHVETDAEFARPTPRVAPSFLTLG